MNANSRFTVVPAFRRAVRYAVVRLTGSSGTDAKPDAKASSFLINAGFISEHPNEPNSAFRGAKPPRSERPRFFLDLELEPGKLKEGFFRLVRMNADGDAEIVIDEGTIYDHDDKSKSVRVVGGHGRELSSTQVVADKEPFKKNGNGAAPGPSPPTPPPKPPVPDLPNNEAMSVDLALDEIEPWPEQPRHEFKEKPLAELGNSMVSLVQVQPILVRPFRNGESHCNQKAKWQIVDGERRWRSAKAKKMPVIRAIIVHPKDMEEQLRMSVISNWHRQQHNHYEIAQVIIRLHTGGRSVEQILADFGKKAPTWVYQYLSLKNLLPELFEFLNPSTRPEQRLTFGQAKILATVKNVRQAAVLDQVRRKGGGPQGMLKQLKILADMQENASDVGQSGRQRQRDLDHAPRAIRRSLHAIRFRTEGMLELADRFCSNPQMTDMKKRLEVAHDAKETAQLLLDFADKIVK